MTTIGIGTDILIDDACWRNKVDRRKLLKTVPRTMSGPYVVARVEIVMELIRYRTCRNIAGILGMSISSVRGIKRRHAKVGAS